MRIHNQKWTAKLGRNKGIFKGRLSTGFLKNLYCFAILSSMSTGNSFYERYKKLSNAELLKIISVPGNYQLLYRIDRGLIILSVFYGIILFGLSLI